MDGFKSDSKSCFSDSRTSTPGTQQTPHSPRYFEEAWDEGQELESPEYVSLDGHATEARYWREKAGQYEQMLFEERTAHQEITKQGQKLLDDVFAAVQYAVNLSEETRAPMEIKLPSHFEILLELQLQRGRNEALIKLIDSSIDIEEQSACAHGLQRYLEFAHRQVEAHLEWNTTGADNGMNPVEGESGASRDGG